MDLSTTILERNPVAVDNSKPPVVDLKAKTPDVVTTVNELEVLVSRPEVKELTVSAELLKFLLKSDYDVSAGSMIYKNVFLYEEGKMVDVKKKNALHMEEAIFGNSQITITDNVRTVR